LLRYVIDNIFGQIQANVFGHCRYSGPTTFEVQPLKDATYSVF